MEQGSQILKACTLQAAKPESRALKALKDSEPTQSPEGPAIWIQSLERPGSPDNFHSDPQSPERPCKPPSPERPGAAYFQSLSLVGPFSEPSNLDSEPPKNPKSDNLQSPERPCKPPSPERPGAAYFQSLSLVGPFSEPSNLDSEPPKDPKSDNFDLQSPERPCKPPSPERPGILSQITQRAPRNPASRQAPKDPARHIISNHPKSSKRPCKPLSPERPGAAYFQSLEGLFSEPSNLDSKKQRQRYRYRYT